MRTRYKRTQWHEFAATYPDEEPDSWRDDVFLWHGDEDRLLDALKTEAAYLHSVVALRTAVIRYVVGSGAPLRFVAEACALSVSTVHAIAGSPAPTSFGTMPTDLNRGALYERAVARLDAPLDRYEDAGVLARLGDAIEAAIDIRDRYVAIARALGVPVRRVATAARLSVGGVVAVSKRLNKSVEFQFD